MILLLRGPASVGKSTIGRLLGEKLPSLARVDLEDLMRLLPDPEWDERRSAVTLRNAAALAASFGAAGYDLLVEGRFARAGDLDRVLAAVRESAENPRGPVFLFTLTAPLEALRKRNSSRPAGERAADAELRATYEAFREAAETRGYFLDSRDLDPRETARLILETRERGKGRLT